MLDAPPHHISATETIEISKNYEFLVLFTSTPGWTGYSETGGSDQARQPPNQDRLCRAAGHHLTRPRAQRMRRLILFAGASLISP